jgi:DNA-directed RNA polymerase sigma subunit (sigma70/sigma32)
MQEKENLDIEILDRIEKMAIHIERIIDNLNQHWNCITQLLQWVSKPLLIDDREIRVVLKNASCQSANMVEALNKSQEEFSKLDISKTFGEIKFIGKRLTEIEDFLKKMKLDPEKKEIFLEFKCDGYELVKKPKFYEKDLPVYDGDKELENALIGLNDRESLIVCNRLGWFGLEKKSFVKIGALIGVSGTRTAQIFNRSIRRLRHYHKQVDRKNVLHPELKKILFP